MGNASGRKDGEGPSGVQKSEYEEGYEQSMELGQGEVHVSYHGHGVYLDPMVHSPPHNPQAHQHPLVFTSQVAMAPLPRPSEVMQIQDPAIEHNMTYYYEKQRVAMIIWSYGGNQVAVTGSWDNWEAVEPLWSLGKDFIITKMLPSGVYHYRFIVDEQLRHAPDLPWERDDLGRAYNILDLQVELALGHTSVDNSYLPSSIPFANSFMHNSVLPGYIPVAPKSLSEFESPPSPFSSYDNESLNDADCRKPPPDLPPQLEMTLLNEPSSGMAGGQSLERPQHTVLNHLYIQNSDGGLPVALGSTHRFRQKYVTLVLYKPSRR